MEMVTWRSRVLRAAGWLAAVLLAAGGAARAQTPTEYELKAIFLYNFTKYVEWDEEPAKKPLPVCILGEDPFGEALDGVVAGETAHGRRLVVRRIGTVAEALACDVVFLAESEDPQLETVLAALAERAVLTVGESERFIREGGIIRLREDENRIRIVINVDAAKRAGLRISSQLMKLGELVGGEE